MTVSEDELKRHVKDKDTWLRFAYMVVLCIAFYLTILITFATAIFQFFARLFSGASFEGMSVFGENLAHYHLQVTRYLTFASDERPFPFAPFPERQTVEQPTSSTSAP
jgi:hypothetical protein